MPAANLSNSFSRFIKTVKPLSFINVELIIVVSHDDDPAHTILR